MSPLALTASFSFDVARGGIKRILCIADEKSFSSDGGRNDPSIVTLLQQIVAEIIGEKTEQGDIVVQSGRRPVLTFSFEVADVIAGPDAG